MGNNQIGHQYGNNNNSGALGFPNQPNYNQGYNNQYNGNMYQNNAPMQNFGSGAPQQPQGQGYYQ
jgi:hypothetical protein